MPICTSISSLALHASCYSTISLLARSAMYIDTLSVWRKAMVRNSTCLSRNAVLVTFCYVCKDGSPFYGVYNVYYAPVCITSTLCVTFDHVYNACYASLSITCTTHVMRHFCTFDHVLMHTIRHFTSRAQCMLYVTFYYTYNVDSFDHVR